MESRRIFFVAQLFVSQQLWSSKNMAFLFCPQETWSLEDDLFCQGKILEIVRLIIQRHSKTTCFQNCLMNYTMISHSFMYTCIYSYIRIHQITFFTYKLLYIHIYLHPYNTYSHATTKCIYIYMLLDKHVHIFFICIYHIYIYIHILYISSYNHMLRV